VLGRLRVRLRGASWRRCAEPFELAFEVECHVGSGLYGRAGETFKQTGVLAWQSRRIAEQPLDVHEDQIELHRAR
jgi:hypothetical protein